MPVPEPSPRGLTSALESFGLTVTPEAVDELERLMSPVDTETVEPEATIALLDSIREAARELDRDSIDREVMQFALRSLCPFPPWC